MMRYTALTLACFLMLTGARLCAQNTHFTTSGIIEFNKTINTYAIIRKRINKNNEAFFKPVFEAYQRNNPQFKVLKSTLSFTDNKTLFKPEDAEETDDGFFGNDPMSSQNNIVYNDITAGSSTSQKKVFENVYLLKDSTRKINWKITDETREIAGYTCRRANAIILDSIYVVAFYTNEIAVSGGPESFSGLPGMILQVALPHENIIWLATKVTDTTLPPNTVVPPKKGKPVDNKTFRATLFAALKDWQEYARAFLKGFFL